MLNKNFLNNIYFSLDKNINKKVIFIYRSSSRIELASNLLIYKGFR